LQSFHMKKSVVRDDIEYIYAFHSVTSTHLIYREKAFDNFNTIFCVGPHQVAEIRRREAMAKLPRKTCVKAGYGLFDQLAASYAELPREATSDKPRILIAPSWQANNILETCIDSVIEALLGHGYVIVVRPHPQFVRMFTREMDELAQRWTQHVNDGEVIFELDFLSNYSIFASDILITDWSAIAYEFSYCTGKPSIFINTPMKVMNPNYANYGIDVTDITLRDKIGISVDVEHLDRLHEITARLLADKDAYKSQIKEVVEQYVYYPGQSGEACGKYIIRQLEARHTTRKD